MDVLSNILLIMQACFIAMSTRSCIGCEELSKLLQSLSVHPEGRHVLDVYKPSKASRSTVNTSSYWSNSFCYQLQSWMTGGTEPKWLLCQGRRVCKQMDDLGKLTARRLMVWTQEKVQDLKEGWRTTRRVLVSGFARLLWDQEVSRRVEAAMGHDQVAVGR